MEENKYEAEYQIIEENGLYSIRNVRLGHWVIRRKPREVAENVYYDLITGESSLTF